MENLRLNREQMNHRDVVAWIANKKEILENDLRALFGEQAWLKIYANDLEAPGEGKIKEDQIFYKNKVYHVVKASVLKTSSIVGITEINDNPRFDSLRITYTTL
jgi:hypothetical protein